MTLDVNFEPITEIDVDFGEVQGLDVSGTKEITENGTYDVKTFAEVNVNTGTQSTQPDWKQDNESAPDFIKNKPTKVSDFENDTGYVTAKHTHSLADIDEISTGTEEVLFLKSSQYGTGSDSSGSYGLLTASVNRFTLIDVENSTGYICIGDLKYDCTFSSGNDGSPFISCIADEYTIKCYTDNDYIIIIPELDSGADVDGYYYGNSYQLPETTDLTNILTENFPSGLARVENGIVTVPVYSIDGNTFSSSMHLSEIFEYAAGDTPDEMSANLSKLRFIIIVYDSTTYMPTIYTVLGVDFSKINTVGGIILATKEAEYLWTTDNKGNNVINKYYS